MSEDEKDNRTDESVDASDDNQNNHQGQNGQDDILKISVSVNRIHNAQKRIKILYWDTIKIWNFVKIFMMSKLYLLSKQVRNVMRNCCDSKYIFFNQKWNIFLKENIYRRFEKLKAQMKWSDYRFQKQSVWLFLLLFFGYSFSLSMFDEFIKEFVFRLFQ